MLPQIMLMSMLQMLYIQIAEWLQNAINFLLFLLPLHWYTGDLQRVPGRPIDLWLLTVLCVVPYIHGFYIADFVRAIMMMMMMMMNDEDVDDRLFV